MIYSGYIIKHYNNASNHHVEQVNGVIALQLWALQHSGKKKSRAFLGETS